MSKKEMEKTFWTYNIMQDFLIYEIVSVMSKRFVVRVFWGKTYPVFEIRIFIRVNNSPDPLLYQISQVTWFGKGSRKNLLH